MNWRDIILLLLPSHLLSLLQETFRKNALGLLSVAETCGEVGIKAVTAFERTVGPGNLKLSFFSGFRDPLSPGYGGNDNNMNVYFKRFKFKRCNVFVHSCSPDNHAECQRHHEDRLEAHEGAQAQPLVVVPPVASGDG